MKLGQLSPSSGSDFKKAWLLGLMSMCRKCMFITAVCFLFLLKLRWLKNKSIYDLVCKSNGE